MTQRRRSATTLLLAGILALGMALPAAAKAAKPRVSISGFTPAEAPARGGKLALAGSVSGATSCSVSTYPKLTTSAVSCTKLAKITVPANPTLRAKSYTVKLTATGPGGTVTASTTLVQRAPIFIELYGDSMLYQAGPSIAAALRAANDDYVVTVHAYPATSICFWNQDSLGDSISKVIAARKPAAILLEFSGLFAYECAPGGAPNADPAYSFTTAGLAGIKAGYTKVVRSILNAKVKQVTVVPLPTRDMTRTSTSLTQENDLRKAISDGVAALNDPKALFLNASPAITNQDGSYTKTLPCLPEELSAPGRCWGPVVDGVKTNYVRADDGLHLCNVPWPKVGAPDLGCPGYGYSSGATRFGSYIASAMVAALTAG